MEQTFPQFLHHGAADGVTGSCHRYVANPHIHLLMDCGLFQGREADNGQTVDFDLDCVAALIVTHVHIDHIGRLPYLLAAGFKGPILCSAPSAHLLPLVIEDALKMGFTRDKKIVERFLQTVESRLLPLAYRQWYPLRNEECLQLKVRLQRAGHILGSAYVELDLKQRDSVTSPWKSHRTVFSGDLGAPHAPLLPAPKSPYKADTLVIESTYGNRVHESRRERKLRLKAVVERALVDGGTVLIPAFSIGRTQELIYEFESIIDAWEGLPIIVDSPLAAKFTKVYRKLKPYWDEEALQRVKAGRHPLSFENLITVDSHEDHMRLVHYLAKTKKPAIVIAASGMASGGRIVNYLKAMLGDSRHNVLFVGYQVKGTPGHEILKASRHSPASRLLQGVSVELDGERVEIKAGVETIGGYSAHADRENLLTFVRGMRHWPSQIRIVHGTDQGRVGLRKALKVMGKSAGKPFEFVLPKRT